MENNFSKKINQVFIKNKDKVAISINNKNFTYKQVDYLSNLIANHMLKKKLKIGDIVLVAARKDILVFATIFACLKIGCTYSLIDFDMPQERLKKILDKCRARLYVFSSNSDYKKIKSKEKIDLKKIKIKNQFEKLRFNLNIEDKIPAYIMFTSGSTGFPKGALISRKSLLIFAKVSKTKFLINQRDIFTNVNPIYFDNSVFDIFASLLNSARLSVFTENEVQNPKLLMKKLRKYKCTTWFSTPSLLIYLINLKLINKKNFYFLKKIIFGGEGFPKSKLKKLIHLAGKQKIYYNVYGPTECTCICSSYKVRENDLDDKNGYVTLGRIWENFNFYIADNKLQKVKKGNSGELILFGSNVGQGYVGDKAQTKRGFILNPYNEKREIGYKTGDIVHMDTSSKKMFFKGRSDSQIKNMGYRIELNEIELAINEIKQVKEAIVFAKKLNEISKIISVVSLKKENAREYVYKELKKKVPNYMIPSNIFIVQRLKKNANGKIDRSKISDYYGKKAII